MGLVRPKVSMRTAASDWKIARRLDTKACLIAANDRFALTPARQGIAPRCPERGSACLVYKRRNEAERLFRRLKGYRRIFSRFEKLDVMYRAFLNFALIVGMIKC